MFEMLGHKNKLAHDPLILATVLVSWRWLIQHTYRSVRNVALVRYIEYGREEASLWHSRIPEMMAFLAVEDEPADANEVLFPSEWKVPGAYVYRMDASMNGLRMRMLDEKPQYPWEMEKPLSLRDKLPWREFPHIFRIARSFSL